MCEHVKYTYGKMLKFEYDNNLYKTIEYETMMHEIINMLSNWLKNAYDADYMDTIPSFNYYLKRFDDMMGDLESNIVGDVVIFVDNEKNENLCMSDVYCLIACHESDFGIDYYWIDDDFGLHECNKQFFDEYGINVYNDAE